jgi:hypothetical protein
MSVHCQILQENFKKYLIRTNFNCVKMTILKLLKNWFWNTTPPITMVQSHRSWVAKKMTLLNLICSIWNGHLTEDFFGKWLLQWKLKESMENFKMKKNQSRNSFQIQMMFWFSLRTLSSKFLKCLQIFSTKYILFLVTLRSRNCCLISAVTPRILLSSLKFDHHKSKLLM